jgi:hypothetical protein
MLPFLCYHVAMYIAGVWVQRMVSGFLYNTQHCINELLCADKLAHSFGGNVYELSIFQYYAIHSIPWAVVDGMWKAEVGRAKRSARATEAWRAFYTSLHPLCHAPFPSSQSYTVLNSRICTSEL